MLMAFSTMHSSTSAVSTYTRYYVLTWFYKRLFTYFKGELGYLCMLGVMSLEMTRLKVIISTRRFLICHIKYT